MDKINNINKESTINFRKGGSGSICTSLSIPITVARDMGITEEDKTILLSYDSHKKEIKIKKK